MVQVNIQKLIAEVQGEPTVGALRWPDGRAGPSGASQHVIKGGFEDTAPARQRYECPTGHGRCEALPATLFAGPQPPLPGWGLCLSGRGLQLSHAHLAPAWALQVREGPQRTSQRRQGLSKQSPRGPWHTQWKATTPRGGPAIRGRLR